MPLQVAATDGAIFSRYDTSEVTILQITSFLSVGRDFRDIYGMRFLGLEDPGNNVYMTYRVPDAEAPYPQDYLIDPAGIIRYWSWEYDPQVLTATIDSLLARAGVPWEDPPVSLGDPANLWLAPPAPNPFRPGTSLQFWLAARTSVRLAVYDTAGRLVRVLASGGRGPGLETAAWDGRDEAGREEASGVYFIELATEQERRSRRAVLLR